MPLTFVRLDMGRQSHRVWYRDEFGQPRYFEFEARDKMENLAKALIRQVNELLARPRPAETHCRVRPLDSERGLDIVGSL